MIKNEIYPKTRRIPISGVKFLITEKLDGSNLVFFKKEDVLYIAQRKTIFTLSEAFENKDKLYKGLYQFLLDNGKELEDKLNNNSAICGEWLGMGAIKYQDQGVPIHIWYMFAKANITIDYKLINIKYDHELFIYSFVDQVIPDFIKFVPIVKVEDKIMPNKETLDTLYEKYVNEVNRPVEGFVISFDTFVEKYVRMKNNKVVEYSDSDHKGV